MHRVGLVLVLVLACVACDTETPTPEEPPPPVSAEVEPSAAMSSSLGTTAQWTARLPPTVAEFALESSKEKIKSDSWIEHSVTYVRGDDEVKVVINEHRGGVDPEWEALVGSLDLVEADGRSFAFQEKEDKRTWMTIVPPRFRVDVKSRSLDRDALFEVAKAIPHPTRDWLVTP